jgi:hypothetical protein
MAEKRKTPRIAPFVVPCRVVDRGHRLSGYLTDLSAQGARVSCGATAPEEGSSVVLEVRLGSGTRHSRLDAEVKWVRSEGGGTGHVFGLTFAKVSPEQQRMLESVVEEFRRRAAELL